MSFRIFPHRSSEERKLDIRSAMVACGVFAFIAAAGIAAFLVMPAGGDWWASFRWLFLLAGVLSFFLTLQSLFELVVAATLGPERAFALVAVLAGLAALCAWLAA